MVDFEFYPLDHSVARAEFGSPCVPYEYTGKDKVGFWSDVQWVNTTDDVSVMFVFVSFDSRLERRQRGYRENGSST